jgi:hypothetical protein
MIRGASVLAISLLLLTLPCRAAEIVASRYGAVPDDGMDDSAGLQAAWDACKADDTLVLPLGVYALTKPLVWTARFPVHLEAVGAQVQWRGGAATAIVYGGPSGKQVEGSRWKGLRLLDMQEGAYHGIASVGLVLQNLVRSEVDVDRVQRFGRGVVLRGDERGLTGNRFSFQLVAGCKTSLAIERTAKGWVNNNSVYVHFKPPTFSGVYPQDRATVVSIPIFPGTITTGLYFQPGGSCEATKGALTTMLDVRADNVTFTDFWFECPSYTPKMTCVGSSPHPGTIRVRGGVQAGVDWPGGWIVTEP